MTEPLTNDQLFIRKLTDIVLANLSNENLTIKHLTQELHVTHYALSRRLYAVTGKKVNQFIRETRLKKGLEMLQSEDITASEVAFKLGFSSPSYFSKCFHEYYGYPPGKVVRTDSGSNDNRRSEIMFTRTRNNFRKYILTFPGILMILIIIVISCLLIFKKVKTTSESDGSKITIAVLPFQNRTNDTTWNVWAEGLQECLISWLSNSQELKVTRKETIYSLFRAQNTTESASFTPSDAETLSKKLDAGMFIYGSILHAGEKIMLHAELIGTKTKEVLKSFEISAPSGNLDFEIINTFRKTVTDFLLVSKMISENPWLEHHTLISTDSPEALRCYIYGYRAYYKADWGTAKNWFSKALFADSDYVDAMSRLYSANKNLGKMEDAIQWLLKLYAKADQMPLISQLYTKYLFSDLFEAPDVRINYLRKLQEIDDQGNYYYLIGASYVKAKQFAKAVPEHEKYLELSRRKGKEFLKDNWVYPALGEMYHLTGQFKKEKRLYREAEKVNPDHSSIFFSWVIRDQGSLALTEGDTIAANEYIRKFISVRRGNSSSEADISEGLGDMYWLAGKWEEGEIYYRKAMLLEPDNPKRMNTLSNRLIERKHDLDEVTRLMDKAIQNTDNKYDYYNYLDTKGYALYKMGKYQEALDILQQAWNETPFKLFSIKSHLEEVKKDLPVHM